MSTLPTEDGIPLTLRVVAFVALLLIAAYAVVTGQIFLGLFVILLLAALVLALYLVVLFYRLVVAVERIAYER